MIRLKSFMWGKGKLGEVEVGLGLEAKQVGGEVT
jgi:hypothetical protein